MKKIISLLMSAVLCLTMLIPCLASDTNSELTTNEIAQQKEYEANMKFNTLLNTWSSESIYISDELTNL